MNEKTKIQLHVTNATMAGMRTAMEISDKRIFSPCKNQTRIHLNNQQKDKSSTSSEKQSKYSVQNSADQRGNVSKTPGNNNNDRREGVCKLPVLAPSVQLIDETDREKYSRLTNLRKIEHK